MAPSSPWQKWVVHSAARGMKVSLRAHEHGRGWGFPCNTHQNRHPEPQPHQQTLRREALQTARGAFPKPLPHHQRQIESAQVNQYPLENVVSSPQVHAPHPSCLIGVRSCVPATPLAAATAPCPARHESAAGCRTPPAALPLCLSNSAVHDRVLRGRSELLLPPAPAASRCCDTPYR